MNKTPWFPGEVKPARVGVYGVKAVKDPGGWVISGAGYAHWSGKQWGVTSRTIAMAAHWPYYECAEQNKPWRGLASDPEAS